MDSKNCYTNKPQFSQLALKNLNNIKFTKSINPTLNSSHTIQKYNISEDQKFYYPYDKTNLFNQSTNPETQPSFRAVNRKCLNKTKTLNTNDKYYIGKSNAKTKGRSTSDFFNHFETIQNRFNTQNLNDFMKIYKSQEPRRKSVKSNFKYDYDSLIGSIGAIDPKGDFKLDTVKNTINAPDPKSSFFRTKDNHFVRKNSDKFFIDERLRLRNKEIINQRKLHNIIDRENRIIQQKENQYQKNKQSLEFKRKRNISIGI